MARVELAHLGIVAFRVRELEPGVVIDGVEGVAIEYLVDHRFHGLESGLLVVNIESGEHVFRFEPDGRDLPCHHSQIGIGFHEWGMGAH